MFIVCTVIMHLWYCFYVKTEQEKRVKPLRIMSKTDKYADKERNSSAWFIVVLITSLKNYWIKTHTFEKEI